MFRRGILIVVALIIVGAALNVFAGVPLQTAMGIVALLGLAYLIYRVTQFAIRIVMFLLILGILYFLYFKRFF